MFLFKCYNKNKFDDRLDLSLGFSRCCEMNTRWKKIILNKTLKKREQSIDLFSSILPASLHPLLAGATSAFITTTLYQPLDFLKTQVQEPKHG